MTIRMKSLVLVFATALTLALVGTALVVFIVLERFAELERRDAETSMHRLTDSIASALQAQRTTAIQWSSWDDAYRFVQGQAPGFPAKEMGPNSPDQARVDTIAYLDLGGNLLASATLRSAQQGPLPPSLLALDPGLLPDMRAKRERVGLIAVDGAVYAITALPVLDSNGNGEAKGVCVLLRELTTTVVGELATAVQADVTLAPPSAAALPRIDARSPERLLCRQPLAGVDGRTAAVAVIGLPRPIDELGRRTLRELLVAGIAALGVITGVLLLLLERSVLRRIVRIGEEIAEQEKDPAARITVDGDDEIGYLAGVVDRTVARQRELAHRAEASQQRYRMLFQRSADAILVVEGDTIIDVNRAAARLFGAPSRKNLLDIPFSRLLDPGPRPGERAEESSVRRPAMGRTGKTSSDKLNEWIMYALDGRTIQAEVREAVVEIEGREAVQVLVRDVTERRRAEAERRLLAGLIEATTDCVVVSDGRGRTAFINGAARARLGIGGDEDVSRTPVETFFAVDSTAYQREVAVPAARREGVWRGETELLMRDGRTLPASQVVIAVADEGGRITHLGHLLRDITKEREREGQLVAARRQAEDAAKAKSSFLAIMSHELRTPLNGVIGMTSLLQEAELSGEHRELADTIKMCADNLLALINDILDLSKIEAGGMELERTRFDIRVLVESAVMIVAEQALAKGLEIGALVGNGVPDMVEGDPTRLRQVLVNLLGNAVKFTERGEVLALVGHVVPQDGDAPGIIRLSFSVKDTGIGIAADVLPKLFKPFVQADDSTTRKHGGTGLGLAISHRLVGYMGGILAVSSIPGQGSTFTFTIPLPVARASSNEHPPDLSRLTVVVADQNPTARQIAGTMLGMAGARMIEASSLRQVREVVRSGRVALILTAQQLADGDARDLVQAVRAERGGDAIGIAVAVPVFQRHKDEVLPTTGADALVVKPLRSHHLLTTLGTLALKGRPAAALLAAETAPATTARVGGIAGKRVLVVEDNATNRMLALRILEVIGVVATSVAGGLEALDTLAVETFDLVLMDCQMPELDGIEATRLFRQREARETALLRRADAGHAQPRAIIVAVTAHAMAGDRERCIAAGMDDYLPKPYTIDELRAMLEKWIG